jgi:N-acetyl-alpha-D-glucosaminyl L-malate synthase BshA
MVEDNHGMKIGITCYPTYGGSGAVATELGKILAWHGHEVHFITYSLPFRLQGFHENIFFHEVSILPYPLFKYPPYDLVLAVKMAEVAAYENLDLLHVHYAIPHAVSAFLAKEILKPKRIKVITTLHGTDITLVGSDEAFKSITKVAIERSDGVTAVSESLRRQTLKLFGVNNEIVTIPNFICPNEYKPAEKKYCLGEKGEKIIMHVSNFRPVKRTDLIVEAFKKISAEVKVRLIFVGDGPEMSHTQELIARLGLQDKVDFLGNQDNVARILPEADLFMMASDQEAFGLAALEAMSCGVPVVSTNIGGVPELVSDGQCGYLVPPGDVEGLAQKSLAILRDEDLARKLGESARRIALDKFDCSKIVPKYEEYYAKVLSL